MNLTVLCLRPDWGPDGIGSLVLERPTKAEGSKDLEAKGPAWLPPWGDLGVQRVPYSPGWCLAQRPLSAVPSLHVASLPASVSPRRLLLGVGMVTVVPGMRQGGARQAVNGVWAAGLRRGRRQGRAWNQMWRRRLGRPGGSHAWPGEHMAGGCGRGPRALRPQAGLARTGPRAG